MNKKINITVLSGGPSNERDISVMSGAQVHKALDRDKYTVSHLEVPKDVISVFTPSFITALKKADVVFIAMHGIFGEDGTLQAILDTLHIPYTGSGALSSALAMDKYRTTIMAVSADLSVPKSLLVTKSDPIKKIVEQVDEYIGFPCFVKPNASGSSVGAGLVKEKIQFKKVLTQAFSHGRDVIIQEHISGRELTCGVIGNSGSHLLPLPPVEIKTDATFFDRKTKYDKRTIELCPAPLSKKQIESIQKYAVTMHDILGCDGVTRSDFILKGNTFYFLETNTIPGLTENSLAPKEAKAIGLSFAQYLDMQITLALEKGK